MGTDEISKELKEITDETKSEELLHRHIINDNETSYVLMVKNDVFLITRHTDTFSAYDDLISLQEIKDRGYKLFVNYFVWRNALNATYDDGFDDYDCICAECCCHERPDMSIDENI